MTIPCSVSCTTLVMGTLWRDLREIRDTNLCRVGVIGGNDDNDLDALIKSTCQFFNNDCSHYTREELTPCVDCFMSSNGTCLMITWDLFFLFPYMIIYNLYTIECFIIKCVYMCSLGFNYFIFILNYIYIKLIARSKM